MKKQLEQIASELQIDRSNWELVTFGEVAIQQKESVDRENTGLTRYVKGEHMYSDDLHLRKWGELKDEYLGPAFIRKFEEGDILYGSRRTYLRKVVIAPFEGITSNTTFVVKANENKIEKRLLPFVMKSEGFTAHSIQNSKGSVNPYVNWKDLANYEFLLPPKEQQAKLAEFLWAMDEVIAKLSITYQKHLTLRESFREKQLCAVEFPRKNIGEGLLGIIAGKSLNGTNTPARTNEMGVLKVSAVGKKGFVCNENKILSKQDEFIKKFAIAKGDVLITRANTTELVGRVCLVDKDYSNLMLSDKTLRLNLDSEKLNSIFVVEVLRGYEARRQIEAFATGTGGAMKNISQKEIEKIKIPYPDNSQQNRLALDVIKLEKTAMVINDNITNSKQLQKSLINQVF